MSGSISEFVARFEEEEKKPRQRVRRSKALSPVEVAIDDASRRAKSGEWAGSKGKTFVGLYAMCHRLVYGVIPSEVQDVAGFSAASKNAARALHELFADDPHEMASFIRWAWEVEKRKNAWAQSKAIDRKRLGWRAQFSRALETDYRIYLKQRRR